MKKTICFILCMAMFLSLIPTVSAASAAKASGLAAFTDVGRYDQTTFADVAESAWYAGSVKTAYNKGIMDGTGGGRFEPQSTIPWAQAVTIAARLHATYHGKSIPAADGPWYAQYLAYARDNGLLPTICPDDDAAASTPITREGLAVLFRSVLDETDLPAINDQPIPDLDKVRAEYRDAVSDMFASGIFTGKNGLFDPDGQTTRAEVATIIARLLCPGQRVSCDSKQNPYMTDQMGNLYNAGLCTRLGDTVYYLYNAPRRTDEGEHYDYWAIIARTDSGQTREVYNSYTRDGENNIIGLLSVGPDGMLYFSQRDRQHNRDILKRLNPKTGTVADVYATPTTKGIGFYLFYDGQLYLHEKWGSVDQIGRIDNGKMTTLATVPNDRESLYIDDTMYCFGGKLCWLQIAPRDSKGDDHLMVLDLKTGKTDAIVTKADEFAYQGATVWTAEWTNGNFPKVLKRFSLAMPELTETVRVLDGEFAVSYDNLYANGSQLYYQVSRAQKLWTISSTGQAEVVATARTPYFEAANITSQGIAIMLVDVLSGIDSQRTDILLPDGQRTNLSAFLNQPYFLLGTDQLTAVGTPAVWTPAEQDRDDTYGELTKAYLTAEDDLALEVQVTNHMSTDVKMSEVEVTLSGAAEKETHLSLDFTELTAGTSKILTFVFPKGTVDVTGNLETLEASFYFYGQ